MDGYMAARPIPGRKYVAMRKMIYTTALIVGDIGDFSGYSRQYCYSTTDAAMAAFATWDGLGDPLGWHREAISGRRRPDGVPELEYRSP